MSQVCIQLNSGDLRYQNILNWWKLKYQQTMIQQLTVYSLFNKREIVFVLGRCFSTIYEIQKPYQNVL